MRASAFAGDERADVVDHELADRAAGLGRQHHADQRPHRRADPVDALDVEPGDQRGAVGEIEREGIFGRILQPFAAPAPGHVRADDAVVPRQRFGEASKSWALRREAVDADERRRARRPGPFVIGDAVEARRAEAGEMAFDHAGESLTLRRKPMGDGARRIGKFVFASNIDASP